MLELELDFFALKVKTVFLQSFEKVILKELFNNGNKMFREKGFSLTVNSGHSVTFDFSQFL